MKLAYSLVFAYYFLGAIPCTILGWRLTGKIKTTRRQELLRSILVSILAAPVIFRNDGVQVIPAILYFVVPSFQKIDNSFMIGAYHIAIFVLPALFMVRITDAVVAAYPTIRDDISFARKFEIEHTKPLSEQEQTNVGRLLRLLVLVIILALSLSIFFYFTTLTSTRVLDVV